MAQSTDSELITPEDGATAPPTLGQGPRFHGMYVWDRVYTTYVPADPGGHLPGRTATSAYLDGATDDPAVSGTWGLLDSYAVNATGGTGVVTLVSTDSIQVGTVRSLAYLWFDLSDLRGAVTDARLRFGWYARRPYANTLGNIGGADVYQYVPVGASPAVSLLVDAPAIVQPSALPLGLPGINTLEAVPPGAALIPATAANGLLVTGAVAWRPSTNPSLTDDFWALVDEEIDVDTVQLALGGALCLRCGWTPWPPPAFAATYTASIPNPLYDPFIPGSRPAIPVTRSQTGLSVVGQVLDPINVAITPYYLPGAGFDLLGRPFWPTLTVTTGGAPVAVPPVPVYHTAYRTLARYGR